MTDEATLTGAESEPVEESTTTAGPERLKAILGWGKPQAAEAKATDEPAAEAKQESEGEVEATENPDAEAPAVETAEPEQPDLAKFAKYLGVQPTELVVNEDGSVGFKTKVDGQEGQARLEDLRKSFQLESAHTRRLMELSEQRKNFEAEQVKKQTEIAERSKQLDEYLGIARSELLGELSRTDWDSLRVNDPVAYSTKYVEFQQRVAQLNAALADRAKSHEAEVEAQKQAYAKRMEQEHKELLNYIPSWADKATREKEQAEIASFLKGTYALTDEDVSAIAQTSAKAIRIVRDASLWHKSQAEAKRAKEVALKKVAEAPKMAKAGTASVKDSQQKEIANLKHALKKGSKTAGPELLKRLYLNRR